MRPIDGDALKEKIGNLYGRYVKKREDVNTFAALYSVEECIAEMPTIDVPQWISVEDRLPKKTGVYLCVVNAPFGGSYIDLCWYSNGNETIDAGWDSRDVIHWAPLPEPLERSKE